MATRLCGDDEWQSKRFLTPEAQAFKQWKDRCNLIDADLLSGLLATLVHEIYTHAEVEFLRPLFDGWLVDHDWSDDERRRALLWIQVHCDGTELDHFGMPPMRWPRTSPAADGGRRPERCGRSSTPTSSTRRQR